MKSTGCTPTRRRSAPPRPTGRWRPPVEASLAVLELLADEDPDLLDFTAHVLNTSAMSFAVDSLAADLGVPRDRVGRAIGRACQQLDRLEKHRGFWRDPAQVVETPNLTALRCVCHIRFDRLAPGTRRTRLEKVLRRLDAAWELARTRAFIDDFLSPISGRPQEVSDADR